MKNTDRSSTPLPSNTFNEIAGVEDKIGDIIRLSEMGLNSCLFFHEVKNILSHITTSSYVTKKEIKEKDLKMISEFLYEVDSGVSRINKLIENILFYTPVKSGKNLSINATPFLDNTLAFLAKSFTQAGIEVRKMYQEGEPFLLKADGTQLSQIFLNILNNAIHALEKEGRGVISIEMVRSENKIKINNNGLRIAPKNMPHIFNLFYSTKEVGKGTGLGLYYVKQFMKSWGGDVIAESSEKEGTSFILKFPQSQADSV